MSSADSASSPKTARRGPGRRGAALLAAAVLIVALAGGGAYVVFGGFASPGAAQAKKENKNGQAIGPDAVYQDLPMMLVQLRGTDTRVQLQLDVAVAASEDKSRVKRATPRILHALRSYVAGLAPEDFRGTKKVKKLRARLLERVRAAAEQADIQGILFRKLLVI